MNPLWSEQMDRISSTNALSASSGSWWCRQKMMWSHLLNLCSCSWYSDTSVSEWGTARDRTALKCRSRKTADMRNWRIKTGSAQLIQFTICATDEIHNLRNWVVVLVISPYFNSSERRSRLLNLLRLHIWLAFTARQTLRIAQYILPLKLCFNKIGHNVAYHIKS